MALCWYPFLLLCVACATGRRVERRSQVYSSSSQEEEAQARNLYQLRVLTRLVLNLNSCVACDLGTGIGDGVASRFTRFPSIVPRANIKSSRLNYLQGHRISFRSRGEISMKDIKAPDMPFRNLGEFSKQLKNSMQAASNDRNSRIYVDMPFGFDFGTETKKGEQVKTRSKTRSNRELARLFAGLFETTGLQPLILFPTEEEARRAKEKWAGPMLEAQVQALVPDAEKEPRKKKKEKESRGFGSRIDTSKPDTSKPDVLKDIPKGIEVLIVVAPEEPQWRVLKPFCEDAGLNQLVIILNGRQSVYAPGLDEYRTYFNEGGAGGFVSVYNWQTDIKDPYESEIIVLWKAYPGDWVLMRKKKIGAPIKLGAWDHPPSLEEIRAAMENPMSEGGLFGLGFR